MKGVLHFGHVNFHIPFKAKNFQDKRRKALLQKRRWATQHWIVAWGRAHLTEFTSNHQCPNTTIARQKPHFEKGMEYTA